MPSPRLTDVLPLSPLAEGLLFHAAMSTEEVDVYAVQVLVDLRGDLDATRMRSAADAVLERHELLRAAFRRDRAGRPVQAVVAGITVPWQESDLRGQPTRAAQEVADEERLRRFDTARPPLIRMTLLRLEEDLHRVVVTVHHLVVDGWSMPLLVRDLLITYAGLESSLPALPRYRQHVELVAATTDRRASEELWLRRLAAVSEPTVVATSEPTSPTVPSSHWAPLDAQRLRDIEGWARARGLTASTVLSGCWAVVLGACLGRRDVSFGTTVSRRRPELDGYDAMVGLFINTLPVTARLDPAQSLQGLFEQMRAEQLENEPHNDVSLGEVQSLAGRSQLFDSVFLFENYPVDLSALDTDLGGLVVESFEGRDGTHYPLAVVVLPGRGIRFDFDPGALPEHAVERLAARLAHLLESLPDAADAPLAAVSVLTEDERASLVRAGTGPEPSHLGDQLWPELVCAAVDAHPQRPAVRDAQQELTYAELGAAAHRLARELLARGVRRESVVGIAASRSTSLVVATIAVGLAGGTYLPLDLDYPADRLAHVVSDAHPVLLLVDNAAVAAGLPAALRASVDVLALDDPDVARSLSSRSAGRLGIDELPLPAAAAHAAYVIYTSGSTGVPKGVVVTHGAVTNLLTDMVGRCGIGSEDTLLALTTFAFDIAVLELLGPLVVGGLVVVAQARDVRDVDRLANLVLSSGATVAQATPSLWQLLAVEHPSCLEGLVVLTGGEALPAVLAATLTRRARRVVNLYGPTETTVWSTAQDVLPTDGVPAIGAPIGATRTYVLDDALRLAPPGVAGDLYIAGAGLARGYHGQPGLTSNRFVADPLGGLGDRMYRTGDVCDVGPDGRLRYLGRTDNQVKIRGHRIELGEIDTVLLAHPGVRRAVAHAVAVDGGRPMIVAYVEPGGAGEAAVDVAELRSCLARALPAYMQPSDVVLLDAMPMTDNGKINRPALPPPGSADEADIAPGAHATQNPLCDLVRQEFATVLGVPDVGEDADFFTIGGHSLTAARLVSRLRRALGKEVPLRAVFDARTPLALARHLRGADVADEGPRRLGASRGPVSAAQWRLWFLDRMGGDRSAYNVACRVELDHHGDFAALREAFGDLVTRHEILRTTYHASTGGAPPHAIVEQVVAPVGKVTLDVLELAPATSAGEDVARAAFVRTPFELDRDAPIRLALRRGPGPSDEVFLCLHHIAVDAASLRLLLGDLFASYNARRVGRCAPLAQLEVQYLDVAAWERQREGTAARTASLDHWQEILAGLPDELPVDHDRPRPDVESHRGALATVTVPAAVHERALAVGAKHQATLFMVLQAALTTTYAGLGYGKDVPLGVAVSGRDHESTSDVVGLFVNTVVLRGDASGDPTFEELLVRLRLHDLEAFTHQGVPLDHVVDALAPRREPGRHPLFQTFLGLSVDDGSGGIPGVDAVEALHGGTAKFDLSFEFVERRGPGGDPLGLDLHLEYASDLFDAASAQRLAERLALVLERASAEPALPISRLDMLLPAERSSLVSAGLGAAKPVDENLTARILTTARSEPSRVAVVEGSGPSSSHVTYAELVAGAEAVALALERAGVQEQDLVATVAVPGARAIAAVLGTWLLGAVYIPFAPDAPPRRCAEGLRECRPRVVLCAPEDLQYVESAVAAAGAGAAVIAVEVPGSSAPSPPRRWSRHPEDLRAAYALFTSGSTGRPKAALVPWRGMVNHLEAKVEDLHLESSDVVVNNAALTFDVSLWQMFAPLLVGARVVVPARDVVGDPTALLRIAEDEAVTLLEIVPSLLGAALDGWDRGLPLPALPFLRRLVVTGEALASSSCRRWSQRFPQISVVNAYEPTECSDDVTHCAVDAADMLERATAPIGAPVRNTALFVLDDRLALCAQGAVGELYVAGTGVGTGYLGRPGRTSATFVANPFGGGDRLYRTGDNVRWRPDGLLEFRERRDHQVKVRGHRVELGDIEASLRDLPGVSGAVVTTLGEVSSGSVDLVAHVTGSSSVGLLRRAALERLPHHMVPAEWVVLDELPLSANGKVDRSRLPAPERVAPGARASHPPRTATEAFLCGAFADAIGIPLVDRTDDFFAVGGDSIRSIRVVAAAHASGVDVSPAQLFVHRTPAALAAALDTAAATDPVTDDEGVGEVPLPPAVVLLRDRVGVVDGFSQVAVLRVPAEVTEQTLSEACRALVEHHDVLRLSIDTDAGWTLRILPVGAVDGADALGVVDAALVEDPALLQAGVVQEARAALDPRSGRMLQVRLVDAGLGRPGLLVVVVHHLSVDAMSWSALLTDLVTAQQALSQGRVPALAPARTSYRRWALSAYERSAEHLPEVPMWAGVVQPGLGAPWGITSSSLDRSQDRGATSNTAWSRLSPRTTSGLLSMAEQLGTGMEALLVGVVCLAVDGTRPTGHAAYGTVLVELESHGRTTLGATADVSRTVGWFTSAFPVRVALGPSTRPEGDRLRAAVTAAALARAQVPEEGTGFGCLTTGPADVPAELVDAVTAQVSVNYLGGGAGAARGAVPGWELVDVAGSAVSEVPGDTPLAHVMAVDALLEPGPGGPSLLVRWSFAARLVDQALADAVVGEGERWLGLAAGESRGDVSGAALDPTIPSLSPTSIADGDDAFATVLHLQPSGGRAPLFVVHGGVGLAWPYLSLVRHLPQDQPLIGLQADNSTGSPAPRSVGDIAQGHLARIRTIQPSGPYRLLGWSFGGYVAHEMAVRLQASGELVDFLGVLDIYPALGVDDTGDERSLLGRLLLEAGHDPQDSSLSVPVGALDYDGVAAAARSAGTVLGSLDGPRLRQLVNTTRRHGALGAQFKPAFFDGDLHLVSATLDEPGCSGDPAARWHQHVSGLVVTTSVEARHDDLLVAQHVERYASSFLSPLLSAGPSVSALTSP